MSGRFLLDTNVVIALLEGETVVKDQLAQAAVTPPRLPSGKAGNCPSHCDGNCVDIRSLGIVTL